ncbi:amino acid adenylation domain-containing protein [Actinokineospora sp. G85]|uniref:amino acid adenylation domain-containing protein n=1 Tax=Actinokineospora sp. G85 TaxID=3406626 RepID=UPI003C743716
MTERSGPEGVYRLSFMQQGLLFHSLVDPEEAFYVDQVVYTLNGRLDTDRFADAWRRAVRRHEMLRTSFHWEGIEELVQVVHPWAADQPALPLAVRDWAGRTEADLADFLAEDRRRGFDLERAPLFRLTLLRHADDHHTFVFRYHHLLLDAWSALKVLDEVFGDHLGTAPAPTTDPLPYRDYVAWLHRQDLGRAESYWRGALDGFADPTPLPGPALDRSTGQAEAQQEELILPAEATAGLTALARGNRLTLNSLLQGVWALLLARHSGRDDVVFGTTVSHRPAELDGVRETVGLFINTLPVRVRLDPGERLVDCCARVQRTEAERREYDHSPLVRVQEWSGLPSGTPLFQTLTTFLNVPGIETLDNRDSGPGLRVERGEYRYRTNYPLSVMVVPGTELSIRLRYDPRRYDSAAVRGLTAQLRTILNALLANPSLLVRDVPLVPDDEQRTLVAEWGTGVEPQDDDRCAHELIVEQAAATPDAFAVVFGDTRLSYREFVDRARGVAARLRERGVGPEVPVGVFLDRGIDLPVAFLAVLLAGGVYTPLDPEYPEPRIAHMLDDARPPVVLTHSALADRLPGERDTLLVDEPTAHPGPLEVAVHPDNLAYLIYTSGSTGVPKGVTLTHRGLVNLIHAQRDTFGVRPGDRVLQWASASFDASVFEIALALGAGAELRLVDRDQARPGPDLARLLADTGVTALTIPPSALSALPADDLPDLRLLVSAGEALPDAVAARWDTGRRFVNAYGPTETTVWATARQVVPGAAASIGGPVRGVRAHVLDATLRPAPVGLAGELYLAGAGLARGYLGQPGRTAAAFLPDPFGGPGARMYRTGDLARWRPDGSLDFLGRADQQVKLRGHRVEPGEVEAALRAHPAVAECAVTVRDQDSPDARLLAHVVVDEPATGDALREFLEARLPAHLVPAAVLVLDRLPLTPSGKLDRRALPTPEELAADSGRDRPLTEVEAFVAEIWSEVLGVDDPAVTDDFFAVGGNSIKATQLGVRIKRAAQVSVPLRGLIKARTLGRCAELVEAALAEQVAHLTDDELRALADQPEGDTR